MRCLDVRCLRAEQLVNRQRQLVLQSIGISLLGDVLALLRGLEQRVIASTELGLQVAPGAMQSASDSAALLVGVVHAFLDQHVFQFALEAGALQAFCEEVALQCLILKLLTDVLEAFLSIDQ